MAYQIIEGRKLGEYKVIGELGSGAEGEVLQVSKKRQIFALKRIKLYLKENWEQLYKVLQPNPNLVQLIEHFKDSKGYDCLVFEFCNSGSLKVNQKWDVREIIDFLQQFCKGYKELFKNCIIHRDIKPDNILINKSGPNVLYKIADFGFARFVTNPEIQDKLTRKCTPYYAAPQLFQPGNFSSKCDIWSLGVILHEMMYGHHILNLENPTMDDLIQLYHCFERNKFVLKPYPQNEHLLNLVKRILVFDENKRLDWVTLFNHPLVNLDKDFSVIFENQFEVDPRKACHFFQNKYQFLLETMTNLLPSLQDSRQQLYLVNIWKNHLSSFRSELEGDKVLNYLRYSHSGIPGNYSSFSSVGLVR